jgi:hypothetical protein
VRRAGKPRAALIRKITPSLPPPLPRSSFLTAAVPAVEAFSAEGSGGWHASGGAGSSFFAGVNVTNAASGFGPTPGGRNVGNYVNYAGIDTGIGVGGAGAGRGGNGLVVVTYCFPTPPAPLCPANSTAVVSSFTHANAVAKTIVPGGVVAAHVSLWGAGGSGGRYASGGGGAFVSGYFAAPPAGSTLDIMVGGGGTRTPQRTVPSSAAHHTFTQLNFSVREREPVPPPLA